jgi:hypothetical protein
MTLISNLSPANRLPPSKAQINYLEILFNDLNYTRISRVAWLQHRYKDANIKFLDDLNPVQASDAIDYLKKIRESLRKK